MSLRETFVRARRRLFRPPEIFRFGRLRNDRPGSSTAYVIAVLSDKIYSNYMRLDCLTVHVVSTPDSVKNTCTVCSVVGS